MSCSSAASSSRSGRATSRVSAAACAAASTRWRSTVNRCSGLRCGRFRTRSQSGISAVIRPSWSRASHTPTAAWPGAEQREQRVAGRRGPRHRQRRAVGQPGQRARRQRQPGLRGGSRGAQHQGRVPGRVRRPGQHHLAVLFHHPVRERAALDPAAAQPGPAQPVRLAEGVLGRVGHGPPGPGQHAQQDVPVEQPERGGHLVLLLEHQPVQAATGHIVQRVPGVEYLLVRGAHLRAGRGRHPGGRDRLDRVHVSQPAAGLLQVGLEQEGQLAVVLGALVVAACSSASRAGAAARQSSSAPARSRSVSSGSPATCRA